MRNAYNSFRVIVALMILFMTSQSFAQRKKLDLEDMKIKGELYGDDRLNIMARQDNELKNYIKFRTNYRSEIIEGLPIPRPNALNKQ